jgi:glycosyltransferase involved in cell wall biosynthesis
VKVLVLTFAYPSPRQPSNGSFVAEWVRASARVAEVAVIHLERGGGRFAIEAVPDEHVPMLRVRFRSSRLAFLGQFVGAYLAFRRLRRSGFDPDVIHAHFFVAALPPLLLRPLFRKPIVVSEHWSVFLAEDDAVLPRALLLAARIALRRAQLVMPVSEALRRGMADLGIEARFRVVPNPVDTELFHPTEHMPGRPRRVLFVGLLYDAKGLDTLLRAVALLAPRGDFTVEIVGDGPARESYEQLARELGVTGLVAFRGLQSRAEVARRLQEADLFVLTSRFETNGCALVEAQATGLPAVATRVGGIPEVIQEATGLLAEPGDPESVAARIGEALDGLDRFDRSEIVRSTRERFGSETISMALAEIYAVAAASH